MDPDWKQLDGEKKQLGSQQAEAEALQAPTRQVPTTGSLYFPKVWQEGVDDEGGEEAEAVDDKEDREDGEEPDT